jgi:hypothetical protein
LLSCQKVRAFYATRRFITYSVKPDNGPYKRVVRAIHKIARFHSFLTSVLDGCGHLDAPKQPFPQDRAPGTYAIKAFISPTPDLDTLEERKISFSVVHILNQIALVHFLRAYICKVRFRSLSSHTCLDLPIAHFL